MIRLVAWMRRLSFVALCACQAPQPEPASADVSAKTSGQTRYTREEGNAPHSASAAPGSTENARVPPGEHTLRFDSTPFGRVDVVVRIPEHDANTELPVLVAFHGRGETLKGPKLGARGWLDDYRLERSIEALKAPPLDKGDFLGSVSSRRLGEINDSLATQPYRDLIVVMPYLPDVLKGEHAFANEPVLGRLLVDEILPRVASELPVRFAAQRMGIDGVSLGGRAALLIGLNHPQFAVVGATQPAVDTSELDRLVAMAREARRQRPGLVLRLLTSEEDYYKDVVKEFAGKLGAAGLKHGFSTVEGNHSYDFNRGPGGIEMMLFHSVELFR
jgi:iron(III)-salmochelin esterase